MSQVGGGLSRLLTQGLHARVRQTEGIYHHLAWRTSGCVDVYVCVRVRTCV